MANQLQPTSVGCTWGIIDGGDIDVDQCEQFLEKPRARRSLPGLCGDVDLNPRVGGMTHGSVTRPAAGGPCRSAYARRAPSDPRSRTLASRRSRRSTGSPLEVAGQPGGVGPSRPDVDEGGPQALPLEVGPRPHRAEVPVRALDRRVERLGCGHRPHEAGRARPAEPRRHPRQASGGTPRRVPPPASPAGPISSSCPEPPPWPPIRGSVFVTPSTSARGSPSSRPVSWRRCSPTTPGPSAPSPGSPSSPSSATPGWCSRRAPSSTARPSCGWRWPP